VVIIYTVNLIVNVDSEGDAIQTFVAHTAAEAARMVRLPHRLQNLKHTWNLNKALVKESSVIKPVDELTISIIK